MASKQPKQAQTTATRVAQAAPAASKPTFIFFKMPWCGHCITFDQGTGQKAPQWGLLEADAELKAKVTMKRVVWNSRPDGGPIAPLPAEYQSLVTYGPFFWLESGRDAKTGKPLGLVYRGENSAPAIKAWILKTIATDELFVSASKNQAAPHVVPAVVNRPKAPAPKVPVAAPSVVPAAAIAPVPKAAPVAAPKGVAIPKGLSADLNGRLKAMRATPATATVDDEPQNDVAVVVSPKAPSAKTGPGGEPKFSYRRPGTQARLAFKSEEA